MGVANLTYYYTTLLHVYEYCEKHSQHWGLTLQQRIESTAVHIVVHVPVNVWLVQYA